ncbi:MAG: ABC transporter permease, partial [Bacteroidota bacterium]
MWSNYLLTSFRILKQNAFFVSMNLLSIAIAFALCTIGYFNYQFNADFNTHFTKSDNIVKVNSQRSSDSGGRTMGVTPLPLASTINQGLSGLRSARYTSSQQFIRLNEDLYRQNVAFVDEDFLEIFNFKLANGQRARFSNKAEVFLTQQTKKAIFGEEDATGKTIEIALDNNETVLVKVAGVLDFIPENTSFIFDLILPFDYYLQINSLDRNDWTAWVDGTFIEKDIKRSNNEISSLLAKYLNYQNEVNQDQQVESYKVSSILDWPAFESSLYKSGFRGYLHPASVAGTISSAVAVLLLALFNFINTSLSLSRKRLKEIGVRKVMGGARLDLKIQFLIESFGQILLALMLSVAITHYLSIGYNSMFPFDIVSFERVSVLPLLIFMLSVWFFTGLLSGIYPAFYISKFQSVDIFRSKVKFSRRNLFSKTLITIQFAVCIYNVFALIVFAQNTQYQNTLDRGYNVNNSINVPISDKGQYKALQASLEQQLEIEQVTGTVNPIGFGDSETVVEYLTNKIDVSGIRVGTSYLESLDVKLYNGRFFKDLDGDNYVIVNQMLNNQLGGKLLNDWIYHEGKRYQVVGIVKDFNLRPIMLDNKIRPTIIFH